MEKKPPRMDPITILLLSLLSFLAGFIDSVAGGGGLILIPSLLLAGIPPQVALGTNKFAAIFGTSTALVNFMKNGKVIWEIAGFGLAFSVMGSVIGTKAILYFDQNTTAKIIVMMLPITVIVTFLPKRRLKESISDFSKKDRYLYTPLLCSIVGFYDGFFGPGTGTFLIFGFYIFLGLHLINASAISKVFNLASNAGSFVTFALADKVLYGIGIPIAIANLAGGYLGSILAIKKGQRFIKASLLIVFGILFITLIHRIWQR
ncbi:MAG: TSUP family transporter [Syntrophales bacterium]|nr:TSUP family transporter [Syntrophales bacterium]